MKALHCIAALAALAAASACADSHVVVVENDGESDRIGEIVSVDAEEVRSLVGDDFHVTDAAGEEVPMQVTYDGNLIFPVSVKAGETARYVLAKGGPSATDTIAWGRLFPERKDDMAWENDRSAYRAYGPALQASGERAFGYDIWTKSVPHRALEKRFKDDIENGISFHVDHGEGMDRYAVGPTLGGGTAALLDSVGNIVYPYCFETYEVLDNGPLRFTVKLRYGALAVNADSAVVETRVISLDKGSWLNRTDVSYDGLSVPAQIAPGIVVHKQNAEGYMLEGAHGYMAYADSTEVLGEGNGAIFVGIVAPSASDFEYRALAEPVGDAIGHILAKGDYAIGDEYTYWWGSGWSKGGMPDADAWNSYLAQFADNLKHPLRVELK